MKKGGGNILELGSKYVQILNLNKIHSFRQYITAQTIDKQISKTLLDPGELITMYSLHVVCVCACVCVIYFRQKLSIHILTHYITFPTQGTQFESEQCILNPIVRLFLLYATILKCPSGLPVSTVSWSSSDP